MKDSYGLPISTKSEEAARIFREALHVLLLDKPGAEELLTRCCEADPAFALPFAVRGRIRAGKGDLPAGLDLMARAKALSRRASEREREHILALELFITGRQSDSAELMREHLTRYPKNAEILAILTQYYFFNGGIGRKGKISSIFALAAPHYGDDEQFMGRYAFHLQECGEVARALELAERTLSLDSRNAYGAHAKAHALQTLGEHEETCRFLAEWSKRSQPDTYFHGHFHWHRSVSLLEMGLLSEARRVFESEIRGKERGGVPQLDLADEVGFLCRFKMSGGVLDSDLVSRSLELTLRLRGSRSFFVTVHRGLLLGLLHMDSQAEELVDSLNDPPINGDRELTGICRALLDGIRNFYSGHYQESSARFAALSSAAMEGMGGSNIERGLIDEIRAESFIRSGDAAKASEILSGRPETPCSIRRKLVRARLLSSLGKDGEAGSVARECRQWLESRGACSDDLEALGRNLRAGRAA